MVKKYISEMAWNKIFSFLKEQKSIYLKGKESCRRFIEAICWILRTGAQWRELPEQYGNWNSVFSRFNAWSKKHIWTLLHAFCIEAPDLEYLFLDATIVRAHACAAGYKEQTNQGLGRSKGGFTSKIHASADALGNPLIFIVTPGQRNDITQASDLLGTIMDAYVIADKGYDSLEFRLKIINQKCISVIPPRSNRKEQFEYDEYLYKERNLIECMFSKMKHFRRIFSRFDKSAQNFCSFLSFAGAILWLR